MTQAQSSDQVPRTIALNNGKSMPTLGLGTFQLKDSEKHPQVIYEAIVNGGYRLLDCATCYENEEIVGEAIERAVSEGKVTREELFIVTKIWMKNFSDPEAALRLSLQKLRTTYVDMYMIHWPAGFFQQDPANRVPIHVLYPKLEELQDQGLTRSIGLSNFNLQMMADLLCYCRIKPVANEVELNPTVTQDELCRFIKAQDIVPIAYTPVSRLGQVSNEQYETGDFATICERHGKTAAQVMLNWAVARGTVPIPRSGSIGHILENIAVFDFKLTDEEMQQVSALNKDFRICNKYQFTDGFDFFV